MNKELIGHRLVTEIDVYIERFCRLERGMTPKTLLGKRQIFSRFTNFLENQPFNKETVMGYCRYLVDEEGWELSSARADLMVLKTFATYLFNNKRFDDDFGKSFRLPKTPKKEINIIPIDLAERVILEGTMVGDGDNILNRWRKEEHRWILRFILRTGLRISEALRLNRSDFNFEEGTYRVHSKGGNIERMPIPADLLEALKTKTVEGESRMFVATASTMNDILERGAIKLGITDKHITVHTLRHIFCTDLLKAGVPMQVVSRIMRHSSIEITDSTYTHYLIDDLRLALNSKHSLISKGVTPQEVLENLRQTLIKTRIQTDDRFRTVISQDANGLTLTVSLA